MLIVLLILVGICIEFFLVRRRKVSFVVVKQPRVWLALFCIAPNNKNDENVYHSYVYWLRTSVCPPCRRGDLFWVKILILCTLIFQKRQENQGDIHVIANQAFPSRGNNYQ